LQFTCLEKIEASYSFTEDPKYIYAASLSEHKSMLWKQEKVENKKEETSDPEKTYKEKHKSTIIDPVPLPSATCLMKSNPKKIQFLCSLLQRVDSIAFHLQLNICSIITKLNSPLSIYHLNAGPLSRV
jgi:hypothetical protein